MKTFQIPGTKKQLINDNETICIIADGRGCDFYKIINAEKKEWVRITSSHNIGHYKKMLKGTNLFDAHRKYVINLDMVTAYDGSYLLEMKIYIGKVLRVSRDKRKKFREILGKSRSLLK